MIDNIWLRYVWNNEQLHTNVLVFDRNKKEKSICQINHVNVLFLLSLFHV